MDLVRLGSYLACVWCAGALVKAGKSSPIVGEIVIGSVLGPPMAAFVPQPKGIELAGLLGVQLAVVEAGLGTSKEALQEIALRAFAVAGVGILGPLGLSILFATVAWNYSLLQGVAVGAAVAPTSLGVTSRLLQDRNEINTPLGKLISTAAIFDDVLSLILLSELLVLSGDTRSAWNIAAPLVFSLAFVVGAVGLLFLVPVALPRMEKIIPERFLPALELFLLFGLVLLLTYLAELATTSFLLGGYLAGVAFSARNSVVVFYDEQVKRILKWLFRLFFAATIAFSIPLRTMFRSDAIGLGACLAAGGIFGKLICGLLAKDVQKDGLALGVAMLGRGEFGFLIAAKASETELIPEVLYAATVWGVFVPTLLAPLLFPIVFNFRDRKNNAHSSPS